MQNKYLPIGTIVTLNRSNKKMMIIGYHIPIFEGKLTIYDYAGCPYPEGMLQLSGFSTFRYEDITNVDFLGYMNDEYRMFQNMMDSKESTNSESKTLYQFDPNGVVIHDGTIDDAAMTPTAAYQFDQNGVVTFDPTVELNTQNEKESEYQFDVHKDLEEKYQFDSNGVVTSDHTIKETLAQDMPRYDFSSDGVVISDYTDSNDSGVSKSGGYTFDANGVVLSEAV